MHRRSMGTLVFSTAWFEKMRGWESVSHNNVEVITLKINDSKF